jgi:Domain of unknown function (DUF4173)
MSSDLALPTARPAAPTAGLAYRWPRPWIAAGPAVLGAAAAAGLITALSLPVTGPGVGWLVSALAGIASIVASRPARPGAARADAARPDRASASGVGRPEPARGGRAGASGAGRPEPARGGWAGAARGGWAGATVLLVGVGSVRAAGWLFALCLLAAGVTGSLALTRGSGLFALVVRIGALPAGVVRAPRWATAGLIAAGRRTADRTAAVRMAATVAVSATLLVVFGSLLVAADPAFAELLDDVVPDVPADATGRLVLFAVAAMGALAAAAVLAAPFDLSGPDRPATRVRRPEWAIPVATLVALFAVFVLVQIAVLFGGETHVLGYGGPSYAQYARGGFWQLLVVTALTLAVLAAAARFAPREAPADRLAVRVLLGALTALTLVIVASALHRMHTYEEAYGFTRLRLLVSVCELWLGSLLVMVLVAGVRLRGRWLSEAAVATAVAALLGLAAANPDGFIADRNVARYADTGSIDLAYLSSLSPDAVPALDRLPAPQRDCALAPIAGHLDRGDWRSWNLGRSAARAVLDRAPVRPAACP